jgi:hypothetical protein
MTTHKSFFIFAGVALWVPLLFSFLGALSASRVPGVPASQLLMVLFLIVATLLLGMLIGRTAVVRAD